LDKFLDSATTPQTKRFAAKVHTQLAHKDAAFTSVVERFQDIQSSQEIFDACLALQRAMDKVRVKVDTYLDYINPT
jgi:hypothetical protein